MGINIFEYDSRPEADRGPRNSVQNCAHVHLDYLDYTTAQSNSTSLDTSSDASTDNLADFDARGVDASGNPCNDCDADVQWTLVATLQVTGVAALLLAAHSNLPTIALIAQLRRSVKTGIEKPAAPPQTG
jgi:hypothetical protein